MTQANSKSRQTHAVILWGGSEEERLERARSLAAGRVCAQGDKGPCGVCPHCVKAVKGIHPDILIYDHNPDSRLFSVAQVRAIREDAVILPNEAAVKVYILNHADSMNAAAQNAMLKILEEPPRSAVFYLLAETPGRFLPTVLSRCAIERVAPEALPESTQLARELITALERGPLALAEFSLRLDKLSREETRDFLDQARVLLLERAREPGADGPGCIRAYETLGRAEQYLDFNVGVVHVAGYLAAALSEGSGGLPK